MSEHDEHEPQNTEHGLGRRRFLTGLGATGLATAGVLFGRTPEAMAGVRRGCCYLCRVPTISIATCRNSRTRYIWNCRSGAIAGCTCCERGTTGHNCNGVTASAYSCSRA